MAQLKTYGVPILGIEYSNCTQKVQKFLLGSIPVTGYNEITQKPKDFYGLFSRKPVIEGHLHPFWLRLQCFWRV